MKRVMAWIAALLGFTCPHSHETWPIRGRRTCLECGREREYRLLETRRTI